jgi:predicted  nucleic acid-binding Zn-ribbon protein
VQNRLTQLNADLKVLQTESSAQVLANRRQSTSGMLTPAVSKVKSLKEDIGKRRDLVALEVEKVALETRQVKQQIEELRTQLRQGTVRANDTRWDELDALLTSKLVASKTLEGEEEALKQRLEALERL